MNRLRISHGRIYGTYSVVIVGIGLHSKHAKRIEAVRVAVRLSSSTVGKIRMIDSDHPDKSLTYEGGFLIPG